MLRERSDGAALWQGFVKAVQTTVLPGQRDLDADFSDATEYLAFFRGALESALFPHALCPQRAESLGISNRTSAWEWVAPETKTHVSDLHRLLADSLDSVAGIFSNASTLVGNYRPPPCITTDVAPEWSDSWMLIIEQRVTRRGWPFWDSATGSAPASPSVTLIRALAQRNRSRSNRRYLRARS